MKFFVLMIFVWTGGVFLGQGCVRCSDRVVLTVSCEKPEMPGGGSYRLIPGNEAAEKVSGWWIQSQLEAQDRGMDNQSDRDLERVPVTWHLSRSEFRPSFGFPGMVSALLTLGTLGIWPTVIADVFEGSITMKNEVLDRRIPFVVRSYAVWGWASCLPMPASGAWKGSEKDRERAVAGIVHGILNCHLFLQDDRRWRISRMVAQKDFFDRQAERNLEKMGELRRFALQYRSGCWQELERLQADWEREGAVCRKIWNSLIRLKRNPWENPEFAETCSRFFQAEERVRKCRRKLEQQYYRFLMGK